MWINQRQDSNTDSAASTAGRRKLGLLALALSVSWGSMLFHNQSELPLTPLDIENTDQHGGGRDRYRSTAAGPAVRS